MALTFLTWPFWCVSLWLISRSYCRRKQALCLPLNSLKLGSSAWTVEAYYNGSKNGDPTKQQGCLLPCHPDIWILLIKDVSIFTGIIRFSLKNRISLSQIWRYPILRQTHINPNSKMFWLFALWISLFKQDVTICQFIRLVLRNKFFRKQRTSYFARWGWVKTWYPCSSHQNSWDLWMFIPLKMVLIGIDPYPDGKPYWSRKFSQVRQVWQVWQVTGSVLQQFDLQGCALHDESAASMMLGTWLKSQIWYIANIHNAFVIW